MCVFSSFFFCHYVPISVSVCMIDSQTVWFDAGSGEAIVVDDVDADAETGAVVDSSVAHDAWFFSRALCISVTSMFRFQLSDVCPGLQLHVCGLPERF